MQTNVNAMPAAASQRRGQTGALVVAGGNLAIGLVLLGWYAYSVDFWRTLQDAGYDVGRYLYISIYWLIGSLITITVSVLLYLGITKSEPTFITVWTILTWIGMFGHLILGAVSLAFGVAFNELLASLYVPGAFHLIIFVLYIVFLVVISKYKRENANSFLGQPQVYGQPSAVSGYPPAPAYPPGQQYGHDGKPVQNANYATPVRV